MVGIEYVSRIPASVPAGKVLVHNQVKWSQDARPCTSGFRAWLDEPRPYYEECHCGWARHLNKHYVEKRALEARVGVCDATAGKKKEPRL